MSEQNWLILGAGYSGLAIGRELATQGIAVAGTTRDADRFARLECAGIAPLQLSDDAMSPALAARLAQATHVVVTAGPDADGNDPVLARLGSAIAAAPALRWIGYLSTVGVYGDHQGAWIDETADCKPRPGRSDNRLHIEEAWQAMADRAGRPLAILRLSGIYGPGRNALVNIERGTARRIVKPGQIFNRIHVADIAGATLHLGQASRGGVFNVTDDQPAPAQDVIVHAARLMDVAPPPEIDFDTADLTPMARSFYGENKRVANAKLKAAGYAFRFPDYPSAFDHMWRANDWRG